VTTTPAGHHSPKWAQAIGSVASEAASEAPTATTVIRAARAPTSRGHPGGLPARRGACSPRPTVRPSVRAKGRAKSSRPSVAAYEAARIDQALEQERAAEQRERVRAPAARCAARGQERREARQGEGDRGALRG
jgi:hypothetical protein